MSDAFYNALCDHQHFEGYEEGYKDGYEAGKRDAASPWHRVEDGLPEMSEIVPGYVCSEILVLYDAESKHADFGYVREKPNNNGVDWLWGKPFKNPTHWMHFEPPKEVNHDGL